MNEAIAEIIELHTPKIVRANYPSDSLYIECNANQCFAESWNWADHIIKLIEKATETTEF